ncbi:putative amine oxidase [copper-containing] [Dreissena polymorpha]|uniref:Amine oxidase n=1 Tax=Dreissena polymorpha TaxID=45954 RepID=A0A9D4NH78_DREPO|nr:putative amine oxidase [copper-containing] [Dreissena polymorpha]KAH3894235.1 hypothetical protein DPMN_018392 [Dreissena polymorpha]
MGSGSRTNRCLLCSTALLSVVCISLFIALMVVISKHDDIGDQANAKVDDCDITEQEYTKQESQNPTVFQDLTGKEIESLTNYLYSRPEFDLVRPSASKTNANFVFMAELHLPEKSEVIAHLDKGAKQPAREAKVIIIRGKAPDQQINEIVVGPLPNTSYHHPVPGINASLPYFYRPSTEHDYDQVIANLTNTVHSEFGDILRSCYGTSVRECGDKCLTFRYASTYSPASSGTNMRKIWYWLHYDVEYYVLHPVDFSVLVGFYPGQTVIDLVWFQGKQFKTLQEAKTIASNCTMRSFPKVDRNSFSTMNQRGAIPEAAKKRAPVQVEPDGKRYTVKGQHVQYMKWSFDFRMSTAYGPQIYDIKFDGERIVYELGLQEISVFYSGHNPQQRFSDYMDSSEVLFGMSATSLVPGADCPDHAMFFDSKHVTENSERPLLVKNVFCLFEINTGEPIRRHHAFSKKEGAFYQGMENSILVLRTVVSVINYDYIFDFRFFQNGVLETKGISTGYVMGNAFSEMERKYAFQIQDFLSANFHSHMFNFKVDLDIKGTSNRYEMIHVKVETAKNEFSAINDTYSQGMIERELIRTEKRAAFKFNFENPSYHVFYNNATTDKYGNHRAYRLINQGMMKQILPEGRNKEPAINWARYQTAVTRHKPEEAHSSSMYSMFDVYDQVVDFQSYIDDDESIVDQDLVVWVTMGVHHIPHKEDLPVTTTPGMGLTFVLQPFNYFDEDPSMYSLDAIRIESNHGIVNVLKYAHTSGSKMTCVPRKTTFFDVIKVEPSIIFD